MSKNNQQPKKNKKGPPPIIVYPSAPVVIPPRLYCALETLCKDALLYAGNAAGMRKSIYALAVMARTIAEESVGHVTADILGIEALLKRTDPRQSELPFREAEKDPIAELHRQAHLNADQVGAALLIKKVFTAWGRHLAVAGRSYEGGGTSSNRELQDPLSSMGQDLWDEWRDIYTPWYEAAKKRVAPRETTGMVPVTKLVISVIMEPIFPGALDKLERLKAGTSLRALKDELTTLSGLQERGAK